MIDRQVAMDIHNQTAMVVRMHDICHRQLAITIHIYFVINRLQNVLKKADTCSTTVEPKEWSHLQQVFVLCQFKYANNWNMTICGFIFSYEFTICGSICVFIFLCFVHIKPMINRLYYAQQYSIESNHIEIEIKLYSKWSIGYTDQIGRSPLAEHRDKKN